MNISEAEAKAEGKEEGSEVSDRTSVRSAESVPASSGVLGEGLHSAAWRSQGIRI